MDFDIRAYLRVLKKRKWTVVLTFLVLVGAGVGITAVTPPVYRAEASMFVGRRQVVSDPQAVFEGFVLTDLSARLLKSYTQIMTSRSIAERAIAESGLDITPKEVVDSVSAQPIVDTQVVKLAAVDRDAATAARIANAVSDAFQREIGRIEVSDVAEEAAVRVSTIDRAFAPDTPIAPNPARNVTLAALLGILAGLGIAFLKDYLDVTVKHRDEVEQLGIPVLASIPELRTEGADVYLERDPQGLGGEAFRKLRTSIGFLGIEAPMRKLLVTSPMAQEGKTTLALNLASAYALSGLRTLLIEADLRRPSLHRMFGMHGTRGLTTAIIGQVTATEAVVHTETRNLSVMLAGAIPPNPVELLGSEQMAELLERLGQMFDAVIVDSPPLMPVADPATLARLCDGVVIVARAGQTDRHKLADAAQIIERAGGHLLGVALNFLRPAESAYDYGYYYQGIAEGTAPTGRPNAAERTSQ